MAKGRFHWAAALLALVLYLVAVASAHAGGSVAVIRNSTLYQCFFGVGYPTGWKRTAEAACNAWYAEASKPGRPFATKVEQTADCQSTTTYTVNGTSLTMTVVRVPRRSGMPPGWCGNDYSTTDSMSVDTMPGSVCPEKASGTPEENPAVCTCDPGYKPDADATACVPDCTQNATVSSGYYDIGPNQGATPQLTACAGACKVYFDGTSPAGSAMVDGVKHWFAKGSYHNTGGSCSSAEQSTKQVGNGADTKPPDTCRSDEDKGTVNGKTVCVKRTDGSVTDDSKKTATTSTEKTSATNPDGSTTTTERTTTTDGNGNKTVTERRTTTRPDGSVSVEETTSGMPGSSSGSGTGTDTGTDDGSDDDSPCKRNPSSAGCGGEPAPVGALYTPKDKTIAGVLGTHRDAFMSSPMGSAAGGFFVVSGGGACPTFQRHIPFINTDVVIDQFCTPFASDALAVLKGALLLCCSFFAFRVAVE